MAVFSNLEGTMKRSFILGKNGAKLVYTSGSLKVMNYQENVLLPISVANPTDDTHAVNLAYFNSHSGGSTTLKGTTDPEQSLGNDGDVYYKIDATNILNIYIKDGVWKPFFFTPPGDSNYVTSVEVSSGSWTTTGGNIYTYTIPELSHNRGTNLIVQIQNLNGSVNMPVVEVSSTGDIILTQTGVPDNINVIIIGDTTLTTPYSKLINKSDWSSIGSTFTLTIPQSIHEQQAGPLFISVYENSIDGPVAQQPFRIVAVETAIDIDGQVTLISNITFSGKIVISGK